MNRNQVDQHIADAFAALRDETSVPPIDPAREQALLAAFDAHWVRPRRHIGRWVLATAASIALIVMLGSPDATTDEPSSGGLTPSVSDLAGFVTWPGAEALPPFESGELMTIALPVSALAGLGVAMPPSPATIVKAEVLVGQDGLARAIRVLPQ